VSRGENNINSRLMALQFSKAEPRLTKRRGSERSLVLKRYKA
jgi:hypothetical protein